MAVPETPSGATMQSPSFKPRQLSFPLPHSPSTVVHLHLSHLGTTLLLFLTSSATAATSSQAPLGSFVYALPDRLDSQRIHATPLYTRESSLEFTTRIARLLARKLQMPVYVGSSMSFAGAGLGGTVEEELEGMKRCVDVVMGEMEGRCGTGAIKNAAST